jgi:hypothetical protein
MIKLRLWFGIATFLLLNTVLNGQNNITIRFIDIITQQPLENVDVYSDASYNNNRKVTNKNGIAVLSVPDTKIRVSANRSGYLPILDREIIASEGSTNSTFTIKMSVDNSRIVIYGKLIPVPEYFVDINLRVLNNSHKSSIDEFGYYSFIIDENEIIKNSTIELSAIVNSKIISRVLSADDINSRYFNIDLFDSKYSSNFDPKSTYISWNILRSINSVINNTSVNINPSYLKFELLTNLISEIPVEDVDAELVEYISKVQKNYSRLAILNKRVETEIISALGKTKKEKNIERVTSEISIRYTDDFKELFNNIGKLNAEINKLARRLNARYSGFIFISK